MRSRDSAMLWNSLMCGDMAPANAGNRLRSSLPLFRHCHHLACCLAADGISAETRKWVQTQRQSPLYCVNKMYLAKREDVWVCENEMHACLSPSSSWPSSSVQCNTTQSLLSSWENSIAVNKTANLKTFYVLRTSQIGELCKTFLLKMVKCALNINNTHTCTQTNACLHLLASHNRVHRLYKSIIKDFHHKFKKKTEFLRGWGVCAE